MAKIGARKQGKFKAVSTAPSINKTTVGNTVVPLPYPVTQDLGNSIGVIPTVKFNGNPAYVLNRSSQPSCKGDAAGSLKGVKSGTVSGEVKPVKGSSTVRIAGQPVIRQGDPNTMNAGNCPGRYVTTQVPSTVAPKMAAENKAKVEPETPAEKSFLEKASDAGKEAGQWYKDKASDSLHDFAGNAMDTGGTIAAAGGGAAAIGGGMVLTGIGAIPGAAIATGGGVTAAVGGGVATVGGIAETAATGLDVAADFATSGKLPNMVAMATAYAERMVMSKIDKLTKFIPGKKSKNKSGDKGKKPEQAGGGGDGFTVVGSGSDGDCGIKPYKDQKCPKGQQRHHIVPDYALRYGNRKNSEARIPGMPSLDDGPSICLSGGSRTKDSEHNQAHEGTDPQIMAAGQNTKNGPIGLAPIDEIIDIAVDEVGKVKPHCKDEIKRKVDDAFKGVDRSKYGRTTQQLPKGETRATLERGETHQRSRGGRRK